MEILESIFLFTRADSFGSILIRGLIWLGFVLILGYNIDSGKSQQQIKSFVGWFFLIIFSIGIMSYALFGFAITF